jgi:hypothetical protein
VSDTIDLTGEWVIHDGALPYNLRLTQLRNHVSGVYDKEQGTIDGLLEGNVLRLQWNQPGNRRGGESQMVIAPDEKSMSGTWSYDPRQYNSGLTGSGQWTFLRKTASPNGPAAAVERLLQALLHHDRWVRFDVPGFNAGMTKSQWGETYDLVFVYRLTDDHQFDAPTAAKNLLKWLQENRPWQTTALMAVVLAKANVLDINAIVPVSEVGYYHKVQAGLIDLQTFSYDGFSGYGRLLEPCGLKPGRH